MTRHGCPRQLTGTTLEIDDGVSTVVGRKGDRFVLNSTALALWELCDGETTTDEMVLAICQLFDASETVIVADVQGALAEFERHQLVEWLEPADLWKEGA